MAAIREELVSEIHEIEAQQAALARRKAQLKMELDQLSNGNGSHPMPGLGALYGKWKGLCPPLTDEDFDELSAEWMREINDIITAQEEDKRRKDQ